MRSYIYNTCTSSLWHSSKSMYTHKPACVRTRIWPSCIAHVYAPPMYVAVKQSWDRRYIQIPNLHACVYNGIEQCGFGRFICMKVEKSRQGCIFALSVCLSVIEPGIMNACTPSHSFLTTWVTSSWRELSRLAPSQPGARSVIVEVCAISYNRHTLVRSISPSLYYHRW